jgi:phosphoribosylformylglycinamidine cyclo-ligase
MLGLASDGLHSNGFSLVRKVVEAAGLDYGEPAPFAAGLKLGEALLKPTRIYVKSCLAAIRGGGVKGLAHITGGGFVENVPRVLPKGLAAQVEEITWPVHGVFHWLRTAGNIDPLEMYRTFNCGVGMVVIVDPDSVESVTATLEDSGEAVYGIGRIIERTDAPFELPKWLT